VVCQVFLTDRRRALNRKANACQGLWRAGARGVKQLMEKAKVKSREVKLKPKTARMSLRNFRPFALSHIFLTPI
jgi:hypothetical protein